MATTLVTFFFPRVSQLQGICFKLINWQIGRKRPLLHTSTHVQTDTPEQLKTDWASSLEGLATLKKVSCAHSCRADEGLPL